MIRLTVFSFTRGVFIHTRADSWSGALRAQDQAEAPSTVNRIIEIIQIILVIILRAFQAYCNDWLLEEFLLPGQSTWI